MPLFRYNDGERVALVATAAVTAGDVIRRGSLFGVAMGDAEIGEEFTIQRGGRYKTFPCSLGADVAQGQWLRLNASNVLTDSNTSGGLIAAVVVTAGLAADTTVDVVLCDELDPHDLVFKAAAGSAVVGTAAKTVLQTVTIPANALRAGDVVEADGAAEATSTTGTETALIEQYIGGASGLLMATTGAVDVANADMASVQGKAFVNAIGAAAASSIRSQGVGGWTTASANAKANAKKAVTTIDTTAAVTVVTTQTCSSTGETITPTGLDVRVRRAA